MRLRFERAWLGLSALTCTLTLQPSQAQAPASPPITRALGGLAWGMSQDAVRQHLPGKVRDTYGPLGEAPSRWDFLRQERVQQRAESRMLSQDALSHTLYFFRGDKLRKLYTLFEPLAFPEGNFAAFAAKLQRRFGPGEARTGELSPGTGVLRRWLEWRDRDTRLRAVDETNHRGFYCLIFESRRGG